MEKRNFSYIVLLLILVSSCATNFENEKSVLLSKTENSDLVNSFDVDKEQALSFQDKKEEVLTVPATSEKITKVKNKKKISKVETTIVNSLPTVAPSNQASPVSIYNPILPQDYSADFKGYDAKSKPLWEKFKPVFFQGEQSILSVTYLGVTAGYITIQSKEVVNLNNKKAFHYFARFKSSDTYKYFYWLDDRLDTFVEKDTFLPMKYSLIQREKKQDVDDLQLFDFKKMVTYNWYKRVKKDSDKNEKGETNIPSLSQDSFSALQFVRGLPLNKGDIYEFPVVTRGKFWLLKVDVLGEDVIEIDGKDVKAIKVRAETNFPGVLKKSGDIYFWYGTDEERKLLKFQAKIKIGSVYGELVEFKSGVRVQ